MSDTNLATATVSLNADVRGLRSGISAAQGILGQLEPVVARQWWGLQNIARAFGAISATVGATFGSAVNEAIQFENAMAGVARTTFDATASAEANEAAFGRIEKGIRDVAQVTPVAVSNLAEIAETGGALGVAAENIPYFTKNVSDLVATTNLTVDQASTGMAKLANVLGLPIGQFDNLASTVLKTGVTTAATESEILNMATRLSRAGAVAGLTADEVLGLSAATLSLGTRAEAGGTALQKTIQDMLSAVANGGDELKVFATVSGLTVQEFARLFREDASEALTRFLEGLARLPGGAVAAQRALELVGIGEARQSAALLSLANGTLQVGDAQRNLRTILEGTAQEFVNSGELARASGRQYETAASQIQMTRNVIAEIKNEIGQALLPILKAGLAIIRTFAAGFTALPPVLKFVVAGLFAIIGAIAFLGTAIIGLLGPLVLANQVMRTLAVGTANAGRTAGSAVGPIRAFNASMMQSAQAGIIGARGAQTYAAGVISARNAAAGATTAGMGLAKNIGRGGKALLGFGALLGVATIATTIFGATQKKAGNQAAFAGDQFSGATEDLESMGGAMGDIEDDTLGAGDAQEEFGKKAQDAARKAAQAARDAWQALEDRNRAILGTVDALISQRNAEIGLADAQENYRKAQVEAANTAREVAKAERDVQEAIRANQKALQDVADAQEELNKARSNQQRQLRETERDLADSRDRYLDNIIKVQEAEDKLAALRAGPSLRDIVDATNNLARAQLNLRNAYQAVEDAEFQLQYLREEGASARDIEDAEFALENARLKVEEETENVAESEEKLDKIRRGADPEELAKAERDLAKAMREVQRSRDNIVESEEKLRDLRKDIANDTAYKDAQEKLRDSQYRLAQSIDAVREAEIRLSDARQKTPTDVMTRAEADLEQAILTTAKANAEARKQQALARGEYVDAGREAQFLAEELQKLAGMAPSAASRSRLQKYIDILRQARPQGRPPEMPEFDNDPAAGLSPADLSGLTPEGLPVFDPEDLFPTPGEIEQQTQETGNTIFDTIGRILGGLAGGALGAKIGAMVGGPIGAAIGFFIGSILGDKAGEFIGKGLQLGANLIEGFGGGIKGAVGASKFIFDVETDRMIGWFKENLNLETLKDTGGKLIEGMLNGSTNGLYSKFKPFISLIPPGVRGWLSDAKTTLIQRGKEFIIGMKEGALERWNNFTEFVRSIPNRIRDFLRDPKGWIRQHGVDTILGLAEGMVRQIPGIGPIFGQVISAIRNGIPNPWELLKSVGRSIIDGLISGISSKFGEMASTLGRLTSYIPTWKGPASRDKKLLYGVGQMIMEGFGKGLESEFPAIEKLLGQVADPKMLSQFSDSNMRRLGMEQARAFGGTRTPPVQQSNDTIDNSKNFYIEDVERASASDIASEIMFEEMVRTG